MNCTDYKNALLNGEQAAMSEHVVNCESCKELSTSPDLVAFLASHLPDIDAPDEDVASGKGLSDSPSISALITEDESFLDSVRSLSTWLRITLLLGLFTAMVVTVGILKGRIDWLEYPNLRLAGEIALLSSGVLIASVMALRPMYLPQIGFVHRSIAITLAILVPLMLGILPVAHIAHPSSLAGLGDDLVPRALGCFKFGMVFSVVTGLALLLTIREPVASNRLSLVAASAGLVGVLTLQLHCPLTGNAHILWGHSAVALVMVSVGLLFSKIIPLRTSK